MTPKGLAQLKEYSLSLSVKDREAFAKRCGTTLGTLGQIIYSKTACSVTLAIAIDRESKGAVQCEELCPTTDFEYLRKKRKPATQA